MKTVYITDSAPKPSDPEKLADDYFEIMGERGDRGEWFYVEETKVQQS
jgi:hypothetical protein